MQAKIEQMIDCSEDPWALLSVDGDLLYLNVATRQLLALSEESDVEGCHYRLFFSLQNAEDHADIDLDSGLRKFHSTYCFLRVEETQKSSLLSFRLIPIDISSQDHLKACLLLQFREEESLTEMRRQLDKMQMTDKQTGLYNREYFERFINQLLDEKPNELSEYALAYIRYDQFRFINDAMGYSVGDLFVECAAQLLRSHQKATNSPILARIQVNAFVILYQNKDILALQEPVDQLNGLCNDAVFEWQEEYFSQSASIGFVLLNELIDGASTLLNLGDAACSVAKMQGGGRVHRYKDEDMTHQNREGQSKWIHRINDAFKYDRFFLVAQPIHPLAQPDFSGPFNHYEVLTRLFDVDGELLSPSLFIPAAEKYHMMPKFDRWVIRLLFEKIQKLTLQEPLPLFSINLHAQTLGDPGFSSHVISEIMEYKINPVMLCFEITEHMAINDLDTAKSFIQSLKDIGCRFSLDDFGTGVSSFSYLKELDMDYVKIDGIFIKNIISDEVAQAMVKSVLEISRVLGIKVVAEYVENDDIIHMLQALGVDYGQGFGIEKPMDIDLVVHKHLED